MHLPMSVIRFTPRWKEELVAESAEGTLVFELTMGEAQLCFPSESLWQQEVPEWARTKWETYLEQCRDWCSRNQVPLSVVDNTFVYQQQ